MGQSASIFETYIYPCTQNKDVIFGVKFMCRIHKVLAVVLRSACSQIAHAIPFTFEGRSLGMGGVSVAMAALAIAAC